MLDDAFQALKQYDWGTDIAAVAPIDDAVAKARDNADARKALEAKLVAALKSDISRDAKDYICRKLAIVGSSASVPALAALLGDKNHSHMARFALERMPAPEAAQALRDAAAKVSNELKVGVVSSLGSRRDAGAVSVLKGLLAAGDSAVARAAALALGTIGTPDAAAALQSAAASSGHNKQNVLDGLLNCAEWLLAEGQRTEAVKIYTLLAEMDEGRLFLLAATRGMLACTRQTS